MDQILLDIERVARTRPDAPCIAEDEAGLSYARMWAITDRLAGDIMAAIGRPGGNVAWIGGGGSARLVAYIAIQKAGQVFSAPPLSLPDEQIRALLAISAHDLVIVEPGFEDTAARLTAGPVLVADLSTPANAPFARPKVDPHTGSHISVTSGSTGQPKAMRRSRQQMEHFVRMACQMQALGPDDKTALLGNLWNPTQFTGLSVGAETLCFDVPRRGAGALAEWMRAQSVTTVMMYPAIFREMIAAGRTLPDLRCIILIGEALTRDDAEGHARICAPEAELVNVYGSMEFAYITAWRRRACDPIDFEIMPMGPALNPSDVRLIDEDGNDVPDGATGEIQITSHNLPCGYLDNPEINRERAGRLKDGRATLRMGDLAYRDFNGIYHSMGRRDQQTKIRGYNVRPPDVEAVIRQQDGVAEAAVIARMTEHGINRLHCYYTGTATPDALKRGLVTSLPAYMTPAVWHRMETLPRTHSGKILRDALPDRVDSDGDLELTQFRTPAEHALARLFSDILETSDFGPEDDFFDLGGDSLQAMRLVIDAEKVLERRIPFERMILKGASVRQLARAFDGEASDAPQVLRPGQGLGTIVAAHGMGGHLSDYLEIVHAMDPAFRIVGVNGKDMHAGHGQSRMTDMAAHAAAELGEELKGPQRLTLMGYSFGAPIALEMARHLLDRSGHAPALVLLDPLAPWCDRWRWVRPIRDAVRAGDFARALHFAVRNGSAAVGVRPRKIDPAHSIAWLSYRPRPLPNAKVLILQATDANPRDAEAWRALFDLPPTIETVPGDHLSMLRGSRTGPLAQAIQKWIIETIPQV